MSNMSGSQSNIWGANGLLYAGNNSNIDYNRDRCNFLQFNIERMEKELLVAKNHINFLQTNIQKMYKEYEILCPHDMMEGYCENDGHKTMKSFMCKKCKYRTLYSPPYGSTIEWK